MSERIKEIRQQTSSGFGDPIPLGADGQYIEMFSGLDLEEELKLGSKCETEFITEGLTIQYYPNKTNKQYIVKIYFLNNKIQMWYYNSTNILLHKKIVNIIEGQSITSQYNGNLITYPFRDTDKTSYGITITTSANQHIKMTGTPSFNSGEQLIPFKINQINLQTGTYTLFVKGKHLLANGGIYVCSTDSTPSSSNTIVRISSGSSIQQVSFDLLSDTQVYISSCFRRTGVPNSVDTDCDIYLGKTLTTIITEQIDPQEVTS